tara:strand:- start:13 stop:912 length:900 start_codon:yes stop_codon:yes gene_type:complete
MNVEQAVQDFPRTIRDARDLVVPTFPECENVVFAPYGVATIVAKTLQPFLTIPTSIATSTLPKVGSSSLVIIMDYEGIAEETNNLLNEARRKNAQVLVLSSGGKLREAVIRDKLVSLKLPIGVPPPLTFAYFFIPLLKAFAQAGKAEDLTVNEKVLETKALQERAQQLAGQVVHKVPLIYATNSLYPVAEYWALQCNVLARIHAFSAQFPELLQHTILGFDNSEAECHVVMLHDQDDPTSLVQRFGQTKTFITEKGAAVTEIAMSGNDVLTRLFVALQLGNMVALMLAEHYGYREDKEN